MRNPETSTVVVRIKKNSGENQTSGPAARGRDTGPGRERTPGVARRYPAQAGPKGLAPDVIRIWNEAAQKVLADPEYRERYIAGNLRANFMPHEEFVPFIAKVVEETATLFEAAGMLQ